tara:strand:- start:23416 stop:23880 length:465 start_codon:yes stop_codon:yes gene_type:complete
MPRIEIKTQIKAPIQIVFDLARNIDLHKLSTSQTNETAIAGKTSGLIDIGESVTWRAKHFGFYQELTSRITAFNSPNYFSDEMVSGIFKEFKHEHIFQEKNGITTMTDIFDYKSPFSILGRLVDILFLKAYMMSFLLKKNSVLKEYAEREIVIN